MATSSLKGNSGSTIRRNPTTNRWELSNDGTNFSDAGIASASDNLPSYTVDTSPGWTSPTNEPNKTTIISISSVAIAGKALIIFSGSVYKSSAGYTLQYQIRVDGTEVTGMAYVQQSNTQGPGTIGVHAVTTLTSGSHTVSVTGYDDGQHYTCDSAKLSVISLGSGVAVTGIGDVGPRLTLSSTLPVTTSDVTAATTLYYLPDRHDGLMLWNGTQWVWRAIGDSGRSKSLSGLAADSNFDAFAYWDSTGGQVELEFSAAWTTATTRANAIGRQNGVQCLNSDKTRRLVGTIRTTATTGQCEDSALKGFLANLYNERQRPKHAADASAASERQQSWRQLNGTAANKIEFVQCTSDNEVKAKAGLRIYTGRTGSECYTGIGVDSTSADSSTHQYPVWSTAAGHAVQAEYQGYLAAGYHVLNWLENNPDELTYVTGGPGFYAEVWG